MRIVNMVIAAASSKYHETAGLTNAQMTERGWLIFNQQAMTRLLNVETDVAASRVLLNQIVAHLGILPTV